MATLVTLYSDINMSKPTIAPQVVNLSSINQALFTLFNTKLGERLFLPEYGIDLEAILFMPIDDATTLYIEQKIVEAISRWEPRVVLDYSNTSITPYEDDNRYDIVLAFRIVGLEDQVFKFEGSIATNVA